MYTFSQAQIFIIFLIIGLCIGIFFDIFRALRKTFKTTELATYIEDIIFMAIVRISDDKYTNFSKQWSNTLIYYNCNFFRNIFLFFEYKQNLFHNFPNFYEIFQKNILFSNFLKKYSTKKEGF
jgi:hypothetical protein